MTWSYAGPSSSEKDEVRFLIGDTNTADQQLSDEEISYLLLKEGDVVSAAIQAAKNLCGKYARMVDKSMDSLSLSYSQLQTHYASLAKNLESRSVSSSAIPYAGGMTESDKEVDELDPDMVKPAFTRNQFEFTESEDVS